MNGAAVVIAGVELWATAEGALWWPAQETLVVTDLHLEKGSSLARRGALLPPYDSAATLATLARLVGNLAPRRIVCLGDSFHDTDGAARLRPDDAGLLRSLARGREWWWIAGNHDEHAPFAALGGEVAAEAGLGPLVLRHQATTGATKAGEISGHFHPKASLAIVGRRIGGRCFVGDGCRLILPAFGAYTGGLDVFEPAIAGLLQPTFAVWLLGPCKVHCLPSRRLHRAAAAQPVRR